MDTIHTRENGYYWVYPKEEKSISINYWVIAECIDNHWYLHGFAKGVGDDFFKHIHEIKIAQPSLPCYAHIEGHTT